MFANISYYLKKRKNLLSIGVIVILLFNLLTPILVLAWKPTTHVFLADIALQDALDDGKVTIYRVDYHTGEISDPIGEYAVDPAILTALQSYPAQYRAGLLGPDAYPDILTGQMIIHPDENETDIKDGPDAWLSHLWEQSMIPPYDTPPIKAFTVGFLTHAAGDMYAHTFVNHFTGAPFTVFPPEGPENAIKHNLLESYIDKRLDADAFGPDFFEASIDEVEDDNTDFIYRTMIDARPGTVLGDELLPEDSDNALYSVPRIFSTLRANLQEDIEAYDCEWYEVDCLFEEEYKKNWRDDIDDGLRKWPQVSHQVAIAMFFNADRETNLAEAQAILGDYVEDELLSMSGIPDSVVAVFKIIDEITPDYLIEPIEELIDDLLKTLIEEAIGISLEELEEYVTNPEIWFDLFMPHGPGEDVSLQRFNAEYLHIADTGYNNPGESFDYHEVPAAYNSVTMSKLIFLSQSEINRLLDDLGSDVRLDEPNIMLGFASTLDGGNQWLNGMVLAQDCDAYEQVFMLQSGEFPCQRFHSYLPVIIGSSEVLTCFGQVATIIGTDGDDTLIGTAADDVIVGKDGNDVIDGGGGNDIICGEAGDDIINGNIGDDTIHGNMGNDTIDGGDGNDYLYAGRDNDTVYGLDGNDVIFGGRGDDVLHGNMGNDTIEGGDGHDELRGGQNDDDIEGNEGDDEIYGGRGDDAIHGNMGNDTIEGGDGNDELRGGQNNDNISGGEGDDMIYGGREDDVLNGNSGQNEIYGSYGTDTCINGPNIFECEE